MPAPLQPSNPPDEGLPSSQEAEVSQPEKPEPVPSAPERSSRGSQPQGGAPVSDATAPQRWSMGRGVVGLYISLILAISFFVGWAVQRGAKKVIAAMKAANSRQATPKFSQTVDATLQAQAERLLQRLAWGDLNAADQIMAQAPTWTGKTRRTSAANQLLEIAINSRDERIREASLPAMLALDGILQNETGLAILEAAVGNPGQREWALVSLGAIGRRGVDPVQSAKIIESYLGDPNVNARSGAVGGLQLLGTDETIPMLLDRFRNDPSPLVQERAICGLSYSGMYTHAQRMTVARNLVGWLNDSLLTVQQRTWTVQALQVITGASLGSDSAAWRKWWSHNSHT